MADFCKQCSIEMFGEDFGDLAGLTNKEEHTDKDLFMQVLCEGCGPTMVDHTGRCVTNWCLKEHNE